MKMWKAYLDRELPECTTIYFSAWETDLSDDPLFVFLGEMNDKLAATTSGVTRLKWDKAIKLASLITKRTLPTLAKIVTYGALDLDDSGIERAIAELSGGIVSDGLEAYKASISAIKQFKEDLSSVLSTTGNGHPFIVFVDELDRCRPHYATTLLERVKHLLDLPGLMFILGIDRTQLANAIKGVYGDRFDAETYLQRFIDLDYRLSSVNIEDFVTKLVHEYDLITFFTNRETVFAPYVKYESSHLLETCTDVAKLFGLTLREIEQLLARVNIVARSSGASEPIYPHLLVGLLALRVKERELYSSITSKRGTTVDFINFTMKLHSESQLVRADNIGIMIACLIQAFSGGDQNDPGFPLIASMCTESGAAGGIGRAERELAASAATFISTISSQPSMRAINLDSLVRRIEMAQKFRV
jgi:hypothetical protein